tara:strand:- start:2106 stop:2555 length:450 start_codon:yes stop_codon:yes gene_type:complete
MKRIIGILILVLMVSSVFAYTELEMRDVAITDEELEELERLQGVEIPGALKFVDDDDLINFYTSAGVFVVGLQLEERVITGVVLEQAESDLDVYASFDTVYAIQDSDDPIGEFFDAKSNDLIVIETKSFWDGVLLKSSLTALRLYGWFS